MAQFATVVGIKGSGAVFAVDARGNSRALKVGDVLQKGETVRTTGDAVVQLLMIDGSLLAIVAGQAVRLDEQVIDTDQRPGAADSAITTPAAIAAVIEALKSGADVSEALDAAAAGPSGGAGGNDGGNSFVQLLRILETVGSQEYAFGFRAPGLPEAERSVVLLLNEQDDHPSAALSATGSIRVDETTDLNATRSAPLVSVTALTGADSQGASSNVELVIDRADTALRTTDGHAVMLVRGASDNQVVGMFDSDGDGVLDGVAFTIALTDDGTVSVTQLVALRHPDPATLVAGDVSSYDEAVTLDGSLSVRVTVVDGDGDVASVTEPIGGRIAFADDGPSVDVSLATGAQLPLLVTQDADTVGAAFDVATGATSFAGLFTITANAGADLAGSVQAVDFLLAIGEGKAATGLTSNGSAITLVMDGPDIVGRIAAGGGTTDIFRVSVDGAGNVTLTQYAQLDHLPEDLDAVNDNGLIGLAAGSILLRATASLTDGDQDKVTDTQAIDITAAVRFGDDLPSVSASAVADGAIGLTTQDAQTIAAASDTASASFAAAFLAAAAPIYGADGPGSTSISGYSLAVLNANAGLTSGGQAITLAMDGSDVVGSTVAGAVFRISVDANGTVTLTQYAQIDHLPEDLDASNDTASITLAAGLVTLSATATTADFDNDTATATVSADLGGNIAFDDDVPSVSAVTVADDSVVLTTQDAQTIGAASDTASASFAAVFAAAPIYGADGPGSTSISGYTLAVINANSGLTSGGQAITLAMDGGDVVGSTAAGAVFRISVGASGTVTLTQYAQVDHLPEDLDDSNDNATTTLSTGLVTLSATATTADFDNDTATATVSTDLGGNIAFDDDVPSVSTAAVADGGIVLTTQDAQTIAAASDTASASFAAAFLAAAAPIYGADGPGSTSISGYSLAVLNANAGLTSGGQAITLAMVGSDVVGSTAAGAIFRISVDANGTVTLTQYAQVDHLPEGLDASNDNANITLVAGLVTLSATATTADFDNDTATATVSADLGGNIAFDDDVPSVSAAAVADGGLLLTTQDAQTIAAASDTASASFAAAFLAAAAPIYGADGPGSTSLGGYTLAVLNANAGLTSGGQAITLAMVGSDVVGSTAAGAIFRISVDANGTVTLTQYAQVDHLPEGLDASNDNANITLVAGLVTLSATATTADFDNDTATATVSADLGGNIAFDDDVPSVSAAAVADGGLLLTTQDAQTIAAASDTASASFAAAFLAAAAPIYGADGPGSTSLGGYTLAVLNANSGLTSGGQAITLAMVGSDVVGSTAAGAIFRISVDANGTVTLTQYAQVDHLPEDLDGSNDNANIALAAGLVTLSATATTADFDNDTATATVSADLGGNIAFDDDVPSVIDPATAYVVNVAGGPGTATDIPLDLDASIANNGGADTPATVRFLEANGSDSGYTTGTQAIFLYVSSDGLTLIGSTLAGSSYDAAWADRATTGAFVVTLDASGSTDSYDFQLLRPIDGAVGTFSTLQGSWDFHGGNTNYVFYEDLSGRDLPSVLVTPAGGTRMNGTANELGEQGGGGGQNVGAGEVVRVDFVTNVSGTPKATNYVAPADHQFDEHVLVNGASTKFAISSSIGSTTVNFRAFDDADWADATPGEDDIVGDYAPEATTGSEQIVRVTVNDIAYTADTTVGGMTIAFLADGSVTVSGLRDADRVAIFTQDGFTTVEYAYVAGDSFALRGFGASMFDAGDLATLNFDIGVVDADNDLTVVSDGLRIQLSPDDHVILTGDASANTLTAPVGQAVTLLGLAGNDTLTGSSGDDLLVGGAGNDTLAGGAGSDTASFVDASAGITVNLAAGTATGEGTDSLSSVENVFGTSFDDDLTGSSAANTLEAGSGNDSLAGGAGADTLVGGKDTDTLAGGAGSDVLSGGTGVLPDTQSDIFEWHLGDQGTVAAPAVDVITDFTMGTNGDALDLRDLLQGEASGTGLAAAQNLGQYLHFTEVDGMAMLQVDHDGASFAATQTLTFENMSLGELTASLGLPGGATDVQIIQQMLEQGNLRNDP